MPRTVMTHEDFRQKVCLLCWRKADRQLPKCNLVSEKKSALITFIEEDLIPSFSKIYSILPGGSCGSCRRIVSDLMKNKENASTKLQKSKEDFVELIAILNALPENAMKNQFCECLMCNMFKAGRPMKLKSNAGRPKVEQVDSDAKFCTLDQEPQQLTSEIKPEPPMLDLDIKPQMLNTEPQPSTSDQNRSEFVNHMMLTASPTRRMMLAAETYKEARDSKVSDSPVKFPQAFGGPRMPVLMGKTRIEQEIQDSMTQIPVTLFHDIQCDGSFSNQAIQNIAKKFRETCGRTSIETGLKRSLIDRKKAVSEFFGHKTVRLEIRPNKESKSYQLVDKVVSYCTDVEGFLAFVMNGRGKGMTKVLIGADNGQNSFKVCCNCVEELFGEKKVSQAGSKFLDSGVKRTFLLFYVRGIPETYHNLKVALFELKIFKIDSVNTYDNKLALIAVGQPNMQMGTYPCHYCLGKRVYRKGVAIWESGRLRTLGMQRNFAKQFEKHLADVRADPKNRDKTQEQTFEIAKKNVKDFYNVLYPPLFSDPDDTLILLKCPPCELHIFEGSVNNLSDHLDLCWAAISHIPGRFYVWLEVTPGLRIKRKEHNNKLDGPSCKKLLDKLDVLERDLPGELTPYITAFRLFNVVRKACFSKVLLPNYAEAIRDFQRAVENLRDVKGNKINIINKMHVLFEHVEMYCTLQQHGLGFVSEQAVEAVHHDYLPTQNQFFCNDEANPLFGETQTNGMIKYNTDHLGFTP